MLQDSVDMYKRLLGELGTVFTPLYFSHSTLAHRVVLWTRTSALCPSSLPPPPFPSHPSGCPEDSVTLLGWSVVVPERSRPVLWIDTPRCTLRTIPFDAVVAELRRLQGLGH